MLIFHIAEPADWATAHDVGCHTASTRNATLDEVGFIHCSQHDQVQDVLESIYADVDHDLTLLTIDTERLASPWQLDEVPGAARPFPHIYGPLNLDAVTEAAPLRRTAGGWSLPDSVRRRPAD